MLLPVFVYEELSDVGTWSTHGLHRDRRGEVIDIL